MVRPQAYRPELLDGYSRLHDVFHVSLFELYKRRPEFILPDPEEIAPGNQ